MGTAAYLGDARRSADQHNLVQLVLGHALQKQKNAHTSNLSENPFGPNSHMQRFRVRDIDHRLMEHSSTWLS